MTISDQPVIDRVLADIAIAAPAAELWAAIRDPEKIRNWFGWDAATLGDEIDYIFIAHARADADRRILYFQGTPDRFEVTARGDAAALRVVRAVPADERPDDRYDDLAEGWISFAQQLRLGIERHALGHRRTLYLSGNAKPGGTAPVAALGLADLRDRADGQDAAIALPTGDPVNGRIWHRTRWQIGLTVPHWGDGLLIVTDKPATDAAPDGRGMAILTSYGLADPAFADLEARWAAWWNARYDMPSATDGGCG